MDDHNQPPPWPQLNLTLADLSTTASDATTPARATLTPRFQFIDEADTVGSVTKRKRKQIRKHVMQEHMRQKRWQEKGQLDRETLLRQRGLQIDTSQEQSSLPSGSLPIIPWSAQLGIRVSEAGDEEFAQESRSSSQDHLLAPFHSLRAKTPDEIDALLASAVGNKHALPSYFDSRPPTMSERWESLQRSDSGPLGVALPAISIEPQDDSLNPRRGRIDSNASLTSIFGEDMEDGDVESPISELEPVTPQTPTQNTFILSKAPPTSVPTVSPRTIIGNARKDPFGSLPIRLKEHEHLLVDHFIMVMPFEYYGVHDRRDLAFNWFRDVIFPTVIKNPISFRTAVLGFALIHKARLQKALTTPQLTHQAALALRALNEHFQKFPDDCSDEAIAVCLIQSCFEDFSPGVDRKGNSWLHMRTAMRKIKERGGPETLAHNLRLTMITNCYDYRTPGYYGEGLSFSFQNYSPNTFKDIDKSDPVAQGRAEVRMVCEEFTAFMRSIEHLSLVQRSETYADLSPRRSRVFKPGTSLHAIIASPLDRRRSISGYQHHVTYGMSVLLHLNAALWDFRHDAEISERYLKELSLRVVENEMDTYVSVEALAQLMLRPTPDPIMRRAHFDRLWFVGRMIKIAKRLSLESWLKLRGMLIGYLTLEEMPSFFEWEGDFRQEILNAPLTSLIMPALMVPASQNGGDPI